MFRTEFQGKELYLLKRVDNRRRGRIPQNRTVFEMRPNKSDVKFEKGRWRRGVESILLAVVPRSEIGSVIKRTCFSIGCCEMLIAAKYSCSVKWKKLYDPAAPCST